MVENFGLRLKTLRKNARYTQKKLADLIGLEQTTIANYENGNRIPNINKITALANLFNVSTDYLLGKTETSETNKSLYSYKDYINKLLIGDKKAAYEIVLSFIHNGMSVQDLYQNIIQRSLIETGELWERGVIDIWKEHIITEISMYIMNNIVTNYERATNKNKTILALLPGGEMHSIGLRMFCDILWLEGWNTIFLGINLPTSSLMKAIQEYKPFAITLSVTMPYHIDPTTNIISAISKIDSKERPLILIGGSAFNNINNVCELTGADCYFKTINEANSKLVELL